MEWLEEILIPCPQCGEDFAISVETASDGTVEIIEDCAVCCRPATVRVTTESAQITAVVVEAA